VEHDLVEAPSEAHRPRGTTTPAVEAGRAGAVLALQRSAGNAAVASVVAQRAGLDDLFGPSPFGGGGADQAEGAGGGTAPTTPESGEAAGGINELGPVARTGTLIADNIIASSYTPGAGNVF
jgi:hypothetical protein